MAIRGRSAGSTPGRMDARRRASGGRLDCRARRDDGGRRRRSDPAGREPQGRAPVAAFAAGRRRHADEFVVGVGGMGLLRVRVQARRDAAADGSRLRTRAARTCAARPTASRSGARRPATRSRWSGCGSRWSSARPTLARSSASAPGRRHRSAPWHGARNAARKISAARRGRRARPHDLDADAEQDERHQAHHHQRADVAEAREHARRVLEDEVGPGARCRRARGVGANAGSRRRSRTSCRSATCRASCDAICELPRTVAAKMGAVLSGLMIGSSAIGTSTRPFSTGTSQSSISAQYPVHAKGDGEQQQAVIFWRERATALVAATWRRHRARTSMR